MLPPAMHTVRPDFPVAGTWLLRSVVMLVLMLTWMPALPAEVEELPDVGIVLAQGPASDPWQDDERVVVQELLARVPVTLWPSRWPGRVRILTLVKNQHVLNDILDPQAVPARPGLVVNLRITSRLRAIDGEQSRLLQRQLLRTLLEIYDEINGISATPIWRALSGWRPALFGFGQRADNQDPRAYAHVEGSQGARQDFVSTAEFYIFPPPSTLEDSIRCRTPRKYAFVRRLFPGYRSPLERTHLQCRDLSDGLLDDMEFFDPVTGNRVELGPVTMNTVRGFELLYATPGTGDASEIAGHLLLRIKLNNNPRADRLGMENPNDLVISFLANTREAAQASVAPKASAVPQQCHDRWFGADDGARDFDALKSIVQSLKGLSGGFLTLMDRQTLAHAIKTYTVEEDRNLLRYRLELTPIQQRDLLEYLYLAKKNYNSKYYFFDQNCASVLVKVIGRGIGHREIAQFNPLVSPPNSLVGMFIRHGLATPVFPSFYSYRKQGFLAQQLIGIRMAELQTRFAAAHWPDWRELVHENTEHRMRALEQLALVTQSHPAALVSIYELAMLLQEAELTFADKNLMCENYTSSVTRRVRELQSAWLDAAQLPSTSYFRKTSRVLEDYYAPLERDDSEQGVPHTRLLNVSAASGVAQTGKSALPIFNLSGALESQDMGSMSSIAMQRGGAVALGSVSVTEGEDASGRTQLHAWHATVLEVRKFKEYLNTVPGYFSPHGSMGLGLSFLDFSRNSALGVTHGTVAGGELLFNLFGGPAFGQYAFVGLGLDLHRHLESGHGDAGIVVPVSAETLWSFDRGRAWQWRNRFEYRVATSDNAQDEYSFNGALVYRYGRLGKALTLLRLSVSQDEILRDHASQGSLVSRSLQLGVEFNRW